MVKRIVTLGIACLLLMGSVIFPLGDFSLARDLPEMYGNYLKVTTPDELSVVDFIGDYLLHGKDIFGHNRQDKPQTGTNAVQFQHQPVPLCIVLLPLRIPQQLTSLYLTEHPIISIHLHTSDFKNKLFRPPLT
jgi:hypothetical protein